MALHKASFAYREYYVIPSVDKEVVHEHAVKLTSGEDAEEKVVVHHHSAQESECNSSCVTYPKEVSTSGENKAAPAPHSA